MLPHLVLYLNVARGVINIPKFNYFKVFLLQTNTKPRFKASKKKFQKMTQFQN